MDKVADVSGLNLHESFGGLTRLCFAVAGVAIIAIVLVELGQALWPLGWWSPLFAVLVIGACLIGAGLIGIGIFGDDTVWTLRDAELRLDRRSLWRSSTNIIRAADVAAMSVHESVWDSGPNTYRVAIKLHSGRTILTAPLDSQAKVGEQFKQIQSLLTPRPEPM
jgi:uncharacterized membrane protein YdbT with pleckstrin-like domain